MSTHNPPGQPSSEPRQSSSWAQTASSPERSQYCVEAQSALTPHAPGRADVDGDGAAEPDAEPEALAEGSAVGSAVTEALPETGGSETDAEAEGDGSADAESDAEGSGSGSGKEHWNCRVGSWASPAASPSVGEQLRTSSARCS